MAPRSVMIVGRALDTTVPARIATNMPAMSPDMAWSICRWVMGAGGAMSGACAAVTASLSTVGDESWVVPRSGQGAKEAGAGRPERARRWRHASVSARGAYRAGAGSPAASRANTSRKTSAKASSS
ncbi:hypothetical protein GCM10010294_58000 [Streptomyces griseoloalbus]|nr:hypothetical protein GCM10010294_58000 [Streptomyces griseoloalbus]